MENIIIDEETIQYEAENCIERKLTSDECDEIGEMICEDLFMLIQDKINLMEDHKQMLARNEGADKIFPHFKVYHRNDNAYKPNFTLAGAFRNKEDAMNFIQYDFWGGEFKIVLVKEDKSEEEVDKIKQS